MLSSSSQLNGRSSDSFRISTDGTPIRPERVILQQVSQALKEEDAAFSGQEQESQPVQPCRQPAEIEDGQRDQDAAKRK
jgi:hypothetical protein